MRCHVKKNHDLSFRNKFSICGHNVYDIYLAKAIKRNVILNTIFLFVDCVGMGQPIIMKNEDIKQVAQ